MGGNKLLKSAVKQTEIKTDIKSALNCLPVKLTRKQQLFCQEYLANGYNATQAAIKAGYSKKTAYSIGQRLLKHVEVKAELERNTQATQKKFEYTKEEHFKELEELKLAAKKTGALAAAVKAAELKGKLCGLYIEKQEVMLKEPQKFIFELKK